MKFPNKIIASSAMIAFFALMLVSCSYSSKLRAAISEDGSVSMWQQGWSKNERYPIQLFQGQWCWLSHEGSWKQIATPFESKYNDYGRILVLDQFGSIYIRNKDRTEKIPLKVINGRWCRYEGGDWLEVPFSMDGSR